MAYTTINKSSLHMNTKLYTGNGSTQSITGVGFQPDWTWIKPRSTAGNHRITDAVRGATKQIYTDLTNAENTNTNGLTAFGTDGFTVGSDGGYNGNGVTFASWNWKAGGGQGSSNTDGSINTTYTSVNTTAGFSISKYTGTGSNATVGHGLGSAPGLIIVKNLITSGRQWQILHHKNTTAPATQQLEFYTDATATVTSQWNSVMPTNSVFSIGTNHSTNKSGDSFIAYCFAEKTGYSKFGSYTGNGNADGTFIYTGFKPAWVMIKRTDSGSSAGWLMFDNKRLGYNGGNSFLEANGNATESSAERIDILSNGFKNRSTTQVNNASGGSYIFMCFAEAPLVGGTGAGVPCTAR